MLSQRQGKYMCIYEIFGILEKGKADNIERVAFF